MKCMKRHLTALWMIAGVGCLIAPAPAQQQVIDGRQLDNNLQVGSGGYNQGRRQNNAGAYQDALITGNVPGLARFRGNIDYRAPGEFSEPTAADDTFLFRVQSLPRPTSVRGNQYAGPGGARAPQAFGGDQVVPGSVILRSGSGLTSGQVTGQYNRYGSDLNVRRDDLNSWNTRSRSALDQSLDQYRVSPRQQQLGLTRDDDGQLYEITASPLVGIQQRQLGGLTTTQRQFMRRTAEVQGGQADTEEDSATDEDVELDRFGDPVESPDSDQMARGRINTLSVRPGLIIGSQINALVDGAADSNRRAGRFRTEDFDQLEQRMLSPQGITQAKPGEDVYMDVLRRIRGERPDARDPNAPPKDQLAAAPGDQGAAPKSELDRIAEEFAATQAGETDPRQPETQAPVDKQHADRQRRLEALLEKLDYKAAPLTSLAGNTDNEFNRQMVQAENLMKQGKFFDAEEAYNAADTLRPEDPMAMVGRINAQLGAGLYMSSSRNLRRLFNDHPELIAASYDPALLPTGDRLIRIEDDLNDMLESNPDSDVPMLIAYLAYQREKPERVRHALNVLSTRRPSDPLVPLLKRIWLNKPSRPAEQPEAEPTPDASQSAPSKPDLSSPNQPE